MCNDYGNRIPYTAYAEAFGELGLPLVSPLPGDAPNLEPRDEIWPTTHAPVIRPAPGGVALAQLAWGLASRQPKARALINLRSEGRGFQHGRCLVPASHYYEFTGARSPKARWRFTRAGAEWFCFAGQVGRGPEGVEAFALLTTDAGPDVAPYHGRQPVVLDRAAWAAWLDGSGPAQELLRPSPAGSLEVVEAPRAKRQAASTD